MTADYD